MARLADPVHYIRSPWIRPEDLHIYESLGFHSFKVLERGAPTDTLIARTKAYSNRTFKGNLLDLLQPFGFKNAASATQPGKPWMWEFREFLRPWKASSLKLLKWRDFAREQGMLYPKETADPLVYIDNAGLSGFLEGLPQGSCTSRDCSKCRYCDEVAASTVKVDRAFQQRSVELGEQNLNNLVDGSLWKGF